MDEMEHSTVQDLIPLYAIGALAPDEIAPVEEHLAGCAACRALLSEYQLVAEELLEQVPERRAPDRIGIWLENQTRRPARRAPSTRRPSDAPKAEPFWRRAIAVPGWAFALAALAVLLAIGINALWLLQSARATAGTDDGVARLISAPDRKSIELVATGQAPGAHGQLVYAPGSRVCLLALDGLAPLPPENAYQVWLLHDKERSSAGLFNTNAQGQAVVVLQAPDSITEYNEIGVTVEPARGSPAPTTPRLLGGKLD